MAGSRSYTKPHFSSQEFQANLSSISKQKSYTQILCKFLLFILFIIAIPLFPSQAPNFINQTLLTKFWELFHLLFIGVAVSYGLFSSRNVEVDFETHSNNFDDSQSSFVSRIFHVNPIFEDGYENPSGSDEKNVYQTWYSQFYRGDSTVHVANNSSIIDQQSKTGPLNSETGIESSLEHDKNSVVQARSSQYFQGESMVVVSQANSALNEWERPEQVVGYKPLGLPVRSLNSRIRHPDSARFSNESESGSSSSSSSGSSMNGKIFGDMGPMNLEEKFDESFSLPSQVPWRSRSGRPEMWDKVGSVANGRSHFRPLSVDETQFESLKSQTVRSTSSFSSQASSMSNSPTRLSPSHSAFSDSPNPKTEESGKEKDFRASYPPTSQSPQATVNREARLNAFHLRRYSSGSLFQKDVRRNLKDELKDLSGKRREDSSLISKEMRQGSLKTDKKPAAIVKASPKGISVRTIRSGVFIEDAIKAGDVNKTQVDEHVGKGSNEANAANIVKNEMKRKGLDNMSVGIINKKSLDTRYDSLNPTYPENQKREKKEYFENVTVESIEGSESETENCPVSSDEDAGTASVSDAGHDPNEVDKKAGEFIAKFREQIRLQKVASIERTRGMRMSSKHLR